MEQPVHGRRGYGDVIEASPVEDLPVVEFFDERFAIGFTKQGSRT
jgi:hypothetical protein